MRQVITIAD